MTKRYDVAIVGGGLVGASLACALAPLGLRVALLESVRFSVASQPSYDDRTLALSASSCRILQALEIWPAVAGSATPIREIQVREFDRPGRVLMEPGELDLDRFGHVVEAKVFGAAVMAQIPRWENLDFLCPAAVTKIDAGAELAVIHYTADGRDHRIQASLLVGADGADSFVRQSLDIETEKHDYRQTAIICNITPEQDHRGRAFECFTLTGPFAVMPHVNGRCGLIWCVSTDQAALMMEMPETEFLREAHRRFGNHLGKFLKIGRRSSYPLRLVRALEDVRPGAVILGNAAHAIHPVGAQGFNLGLRDVAVLAELLQDESRKGADANYGNIDLLTRYSEWRKPDQAGTIAYSDGLARIFSNPTRLAAAARTAGILAHAFVPSLRRQLAVRSMGYRGRTPRLAAGEPL
ncbi:MAG: 2-octaprenyl-6-methoxyphenyl hydroxylase [Xanthomonadales bacterium]|nr:2-octaprenyl-6-methoxyphenyl hydroxylase [Gammaproteobacteria bacterium]MBT8052657.1 2-octaprenyl-6-methoxyphenyl hydroxylase [Gammaproteobacteria bacterium]NNK52474.1 2-octaprenyl-6-methoxyphenyl hydroxylase [Xanthomonadales bacterium]